MTQKATEPESMRVFNGFESRRLDSWVNGLNSCSPFIYAVLGMFKIAANSVFTVENSVKYDTG